MGDQIRWMVTPKTVCMCMLFALIIMVIKNKIMIISNTGNNIQICIVS